MGDNKFLRVFGTFFLILILLGLIASIIFTSTEIFNISKQIKSLSTDPYHQNTDQINYLKSVKLSLVVTLVSTSIIEIALAIFVYTLGHKVAENSEAIAKLKTNTNVLISKNEEVEKKEVEETKIKIEKIKIGDKVELINSKFFPSNNIRLPGKTSGTVTKKNGDKLKVLFETPSTRIEAEVEKAEIVPVK